MKRFAALVVASAAALNVAGCQAAADAEPTPAAQQVPAPERLSTPEHDSMGFPFSEAVRFGDVLYLSGQIGNVPGEARLVEGGIQAETRQTLDNIKAVLERNGSSMDRVIRCLVMIDDMAEWPAMNEVYAEYFPGPKPSRSALGADGLALGARVEIECTAAAGN